MKYGQCCVQVQHANKVVNSQGSTVIWKLKSHRTVIKGAIVTEVESMLVAKGNVDNDSYRSSVLAHPDEEVNIESHHQSNTGSHPSNMIHTKETSEYGGSAIADSNGNTTITSSQQQWLDPSFQLNVPLVDVDKVVTGQNLLIYGLRFNGICVKFNGE
ncbi:carnosine N-methyltransferase [Trifolium repens]|nr:carnosine N-methyltransferase [Trifolium repens]